MRVRSPDMNQDHALFGRTLDEIESDHDMYDETGNVPSDQCETPASDYFADELAWESDDYSYDDRDRFIPGQGRYESEGTDEDELAWEDEAAQDEAADPTQLGLTEDEWVESAIDYLTHEYPEEYPEVPF
jgi:hypothetical protein